VLMTIGLGVATYYGFADQEANAKTLKEAKDNENLFKVEREWYRGQAFLYRSMMGYPVAGLAANDLDDAKKGIENHTLGKTQSKDPVKDRADVEKLIGETLGGKIGWDPAAKKAKTSYEDMLKKKDADIDALQKSTTGLEQRVAAAEKKAKD